MTKILLPILVLLGTWAAPALAAQRHPATPHCSTPRGWKIAAKDAQTVVIDRDFPTPLGPAPTYRYCARAGGTFRLLVRTEACCGGEEPNLVDLKLAGPYLAYRAESDGRATGQWNARITIINVRTGRSAATGMRSTTFRLSSDGVVAWLAQPMFDQWSVGAFAASSGREVTLDTSSQNDLANLELYQCTAGCAHTMTVIGWTHDGVHHYAGVS